MYRFIYTFFSYVLIFFLLCRSAIPKQWQTNGNLGRHFFLVPECNGNVPEMNRGE